MAEIEIRILGPLEVELGGRVLALGGQQQRALLALLAIHANHVIPRDRLVEELWGEPLPPRATKRLHVAMTRLRQALEDHGEAAVLVSEAGGYRLALEPGQLDLDRFETLTAAGRRALELGQPEDCIVSLDAALDLWRGPPLADVTYAPFAQAEIERLHELRLAVIEDRTAAELDLGHDHVLIPALGRLVAEHPLRERLRGQLMLSLYRAGRHAHALECFEEGRRRLDAELGLRPGPELSRLQQAVLTHDPMLGPGGGRQDEPSAVVPALPSRLAVARSGEFVGRERELEAIDSALRAAAGGATRVVLVSGEPGIGKTRLAAEAAERAKAVVVYGRCDEELAAPHQPWREALGQWVQSAPAATLASHTERDGRVLGRLVPALDDRLSHAASPQRADPETERYLLYAAVAELLAEGTASQPVVLVLDDLHWADKPSLLLLRHVVAVAPAMALLIIATFRSTEVANDHPLSNLLADFDREQGVNRLALEGLAHADVLGLVDARAVRGDAREQLAQTLRHETGGNPFFVKELLRNFAESAELPKPLPGTVREVVLRRVDRLGAGAREILSAAAVIGREFDTQPLRELARTDEELLVDVLDAAVRAALLAPVPGFGGRYGFVHSLIQTALYEQLGTGHRRRLHRRFAEVLEALWGDATGVRRAELAHHWYAGGEPDDAARVALRARQAGDVALTELAPDEAVRWYRRALECLERGYGSSDGERCDVRIRLGDALRQAGDPTFRETLLRAARDAEAMGDRDRLVRAALTNSRGFVSASGDVDDERVAVLEAALAAEQDDGAPRAQLLALLAIELTFSGEWKRRRSLIDEALRVARQAGDTATLSRALTVRAVSWTPQTTILELRTNATEALRVADQLSDPVAEFHAVHWHAVVCVRTGDVEAARASVEREAKLATHLGQPTLRWQARFAEANLALMAGRLTDAERLAGHALELGTATNQLDAQAFYIGQLFNIRDDQGRLGELRPLLTVALAEHPGFPGLGALLALASYEDGAEAEARRLFSSAATERFAQLPYDVTWLTVLCVYARVAKHLDATAAAQVLYDLLSPFADQVASTGIAASMTVAHHLGVLATALGRYDDAERHLRDALSRHERMGARVWLARTRLALAELLLERGDTSGVIQTLLQQAHGVARELGAHGIERRVAALGVESAVRS